MKAAETAAGQVTAAILAAISEPFFIFDADGRYVEIIGGSDRSRYHDGQHLIGKTIHDVIEPNLADEFVARIRQALEAGRPLTYEYQLSAQDIKGSEQLDGPAGKLWFEAHISPIAADIEPRQVVWIAFNITRLKQALLEKEALNVELRQAISEIKTLRGILPICSFCKKIRDDSGRWTRLENYIHKHSDASLSHGLCPDCLRDHYPDYT